MPDDLAPEILREAETQLLQLNAQIVAAQLTLQVCFVLTSIDHRVLNYGANHFSV